MFHIKLVGMEALRRQMEALAAAPDDMTATYLKVGQNLEADMKARAPLGPTGNLRRSIHTKQYAEVVVVAVDRKVAPHAGLVEFGTSKMTPRPYFRPAVDAAKGIAGDIKATIMKAIK